MASMPAAYLTFLAFALGLLARSAFATECKGSVFGWDCTRQCRCKSTSATCANHNGKCPSDCAWGYDSFNCQQRNKALFQKVNVTGERFYPGTGTEVRHLTGDKVVDNDLSTNLSRCALAYRRDGQPPLKLSVDLGQEVRVNHITLLGADYDHPIKSRLTLEVDGNICHERNLPYAPPQREDVKCVDDVIGRVVKMTSYHKMIKLCELQVWECVDGMYGPRCERQCRCKDPTEVCDKVTGKCRTGCALGHRLKDCQECNVALVKKCAQSSLRPSSKDSPGGHCQYAVDGLRSSAIQFCAETRNSRGPGWIEVDLGSSRYVTKVDIYGHHSHLSRLRGLVVMVDGKVCSEHVETLHRVTEPVARVTCQGKLFGRMLRVERKNPADGDKELTVCELEVWECADGTWGPGCMYTCNCKDMTEVCHKMTGQCKSGCRLGFRGEGCREACSVSKFGQNCERTCHCYEGRAVCSPHDGNCSLGCAPGWIGEGCDRPCPRGKYGVNCAFHCPECVYGDKTLECDSKTGECLGCPKSFDGMTCADKCQPGTFGRKCWLTCHCKNSEPCHQRTGHCENGCAAGWYGDNCQTKDNEPSYTISIDGKDCAGKLQPSVKDQPVICTSHLSGTEVTIRRDEGNIQLCEVEIWECEGSTWGTDCKHQCNCESEAEECNRHTGVCVERCGEAFRGDACQIQNVALRKPTRQSSLYFHDASQSMQYPHLAVDGSLDPSQGRCAETQPMSDSWWEVDLLKPVQINRISVLKQKYSSWKMSSLRIEVDEEMCVDSSKTPIDIPAGKQGDLYCSKNMIGQIVRFEDPREIVLCEVMVWVCIDGTWGRDCEFACSCQDNNEVCNKFDGRCVGKVAKNYQAANNTRAPRAARIAASHGDTAQPYGLLMQMVLLLCICVLNTWMASSHPPVSLAPH